MIFIQLDDFQILCNSVNILHQINTRLKYENDTKDAVIGILKKEKNDLAERIIDLDSKKCRCSPGVRGVQERKRKNFFNLTNRQTINVRGKINFVLNELNNYFDSFELDLYKVTLLKKQSSGTSHELEILPKIKKKCTVQSCLYFKDKYLISDHTYRSLRKNLGLDIPPTDELILERNKINSIFSIYQIDEGFYTDVRKQIIDRLTYLFSTKKISDNLIKIKLTADGTVLSRSMKVINFCFSIINQGKTAAGLNGIYPIGIFKIDNENYELIKNWMSEIWASLKYFNYFQFEEKKITIEYYFSSDWKMMSIVLGLYSASSNYPCLWCECPKIDLSKIQVNPRRSYKRNREILEKSSKTKREHFGYKEYPLLEEISHSKFIIDLLHLFLRISDVLFELLKHELCRIDKFSNSSQFNEKKHIELKKLSDFIKTKCGISIKYLSRDQVGLDDFEQAASHKENSDF